MLVFHFPPNLNDVNICLIPKKKVPDNMGYLHPIALCNILYKVMAKALANRMKSMIGEVILKSRNLEVFYPQ